MKAVSHGDKLLSLSDPSIWAPNVWEALQFPFDWESEILGFLYACLISASVRCWFLLPRKPHTLSRLPFYGFLLLRTVFIPVVVFLLLLFFPLASHGALNTAISAALGSIAQGFASCSVSQFIQRSEFGVLGRLIKGWYNFKGILEHCCHGHRVLSGDKHAWGVVDGMGVRDIELRSRV